MRSALLTFFLFFSFALFASDVYQCPMKCEGAKVYSSPRACPVCGMALEKKAHKHDAYSGLENDLTYRVDLTSIPAPDAGKPVKLTFRPRDTTSEKAIPLRESSGAPFHAIIASQDLDFFSHVLPAPIASGGYETEFRFPRAGNYVVYADFAPERGKPQVVPLAIQVPGAVEPSKGMSWEGIANLRDYTFSISHGPLRIGKKAKLTFQIVKKETTLREVTPYLGDIGYLTIISEDTSRYLHGRSLSKKFPATFEVTFSARGHYRLWLEVMLAGHVITFPFNLDVK